MICVQLIILLSVQVRPGVRAYIIAYRNEINGIKLKNIITHTHTNACTQLLLLQYYYYYYYYCFMLCYVLASLFPVRVCRFNFFLFIIMFFFTKSVEWAVVGGNNDNKLYTYTHTRLSY